MYQLQSIRRRLRFAAVMGMGLASASTFAQTGPDLLVRPLDKDKLLDGSVSALFEQDGHTNNADQMQMSIYDSQARFRVAPGSRPDPRVGYDFTYIDLNTNDPALPNALTNVAIGFGMGVADNDGWLAGFTLGLGYAASSAFNDGNAWYGKADLVLGKELDKSSAIGFVLDYDGNRTFLPDVPLPGFAYTKRIDEKLALVVGFPFTSIEWKPIEKLKIDVKYVFPDEAGLLVDYEIFKQLGAFGSYAARQQGFHDNQLSNSSDRILFSQRTAEVGLRWTPIQELSVVGAVGYAFSQEFNVGYDSQDQDRLAKPSDEPYLRFALEVKY